jgi:predicted transcriptional regulator
VKLTEKQREALTKLACGSLTSWAFASTTVNVLRKNGLVENLRVNGANHLQITEAGRRALNPGGTS